MEYRVLGPLEVRDGERSLPLAGAKQRALLALLLVKANHVVSRERLIDELWGEQPPETAVQSLQVYVSRLRKLLPSDTLLTRPPGYLLEVASDELDLQRFERLLADGHEALAQGDPERASAVLHEALALWRGPALAEFAFEPFAQAEIGRLEDLRLAAVEERIEADLALGRHADLIGELEALIAENPHRERLRGELMLALYRSGRQAEALEAYQAARRALVEELGIDPGAALEQLQRQILNQDPALALEPRPLVLKQTNLPVAPNALIGRERELAEAAALLRRDDVRLLTLVGPGGTGKTRLALQLAADAVEEFDHGVFWVSLATVHDPALVEPTIAQTVGAKDGLAEKLAGKRALLLLDNFEHVAEAALALASLLADAPDVKLLVTSREPLHLAGEREFPVPPLREPEAVALFVERAYTAEPDDVSADICRRLDCLPLAVELAAARTKVLTPPALLARLERRLPLLTGGPRDAPERQRTLRATIEWSYDLLEPEEQRLFARLAVFAGGFTLESAEHVCGATVDNVHSLVDKSLLRAEGARFSMLETIREYALEQLDRADPDGTFRDRHAEYFLELAEEATPRFSWIAERAEAELDGPDPTEWLNRLAGETANFRSALVWSAASGDTDVHGRLATSLGVFWFARGDVTEGRAWLEGVLALRSQLPRELRAKALEAAMNLVRFQGDHQRAKALAEEQLTLSRELDDPNAVAGALHDLGLLAADEGDHERARALYEEAVRLGRRVGHKHVGLWITDLGSLARWQGDLARASALLEEALAIHRQSGDTAAIAYASDELGVVALHQGRPGDARALLAEGLRNWQALGATNLIVVSLDTHAAAIAAQGEGERAARLLGAAAALREAMAIRPLHHQKSESPGKLAAATAHAQLGEEAFAAAFARGRVMGLDQAVADALEGTATMGRHGASKTVMR